MDGSFWNELYGVEHDRYGDAPNAFVAAEAHRLPEGARVLCVGDGEGRNGVWLAEQGFDVTTVDLSRVGVEKARTRAERRGVALDALVGRFPEVAGDAGPFDAIVLVYVHAPPDARRALHRACVDRLSPGGWIVLEAFTPGQLGRDSGGPQAEPLLFTEAGLREDFEDLDVVYAEETEVVLDEGPGHRGAAAVVRFLARRP